MSCELIKLLTVQVDEHSASFAFAVKTARFAFFARSYIFKAGRTVGVDDVFIHNSVFHQTFQAPIDGGGAN